MSSEYYIYIVHFGDGIERFQATAAAQTIERMTGVDTYAVAGGDPEHFTLYYKGRKVPKRYIISEVGDMISFAVTLSDPGRIGMPEVGL